MDFHVGSVDLAYNTSYIGGAGYCRFIMVKSVKIGHGIHVKSRGKLSSGLAWRLGVSHVLPISFSTPKQAKWLPSLSRFGAYLPIVSQ